MIRITDATTIRSRDLKSTTTAETVLYGHIAACIVLAVDPFECKGKITEQYKHNAIIMTGNSNLFT